jgi:hypothetical protein
VGWHSVADATAFANVYYWEILPERTLDGLWPTAEVSRTAAIDPEAVNYMRPRFSRSAWKADASFIVRGQSVAS